MSFTPSNVMLDLELRADYLVFGLATVTAVRALTAKPPPAGNIGGKTPGHYSYAALDALVGRGPNLRFLESAGVRKAVCGHVLAGLVAERAALRLAQRGELPRTTAGAVYADLPLGWPLAVAAALRWRADVGMAVLGVHPALALAHAEPVSRDERVAAFMSREVGEDVKVRHGSLKERFARLEPSWLDGTYRRAADALFADAERDLSSTARPA